MMLGPALSPGVGATARRQVGLRGSPSELTARQVLRWAHKVVLRPAVVGTRGSPDEG